MTNAWVSDDDFEDIEDWSDDLIDMDEPDQQRNQTEVSQQKQRASTPLPEFLDSEVTDELAGEMAPVWLGTRWRDIPEADQLDAWNGLREWVDWLVKEYKLTGAVVPPCWYKHTDIVAELYAAMCMEHKVWEEGEPGLNPMMFWHPNLHQMIHRLRESVTGAGCYSAEEHKEPLAMKGKAPFELDYDETDWNSHVSTAMTSQRIDRPDEGVRYVRAGLVNNKGEMIAQSEPVGVKHREAQKRETVELQYVAANNDYNVLTAVRRQYSDDHLLSWEISKDGKSWESVTEDELAEQ